MLKKDTFLFFALATIIILGLLILGSISFHDFPVFFSLKKQLLFLVLGIIAFLFFSFVDWRIFTSSSLLLFLYLISLFSLILLLVLGNRVRGAAGWFNFGIFSFQPLEIVKIILILLLAKYLSSRNLEIWQFRHLVGSGFFVLLPMALVMAQPDLGGAMILGAIWFGMVLVSGIRLKQIFILIIVFLLAAAFIWFFVLKPYQKARIINFVYPQEDPLGAGYNREQALIAIGSGRIFGKGLGRGSQTQLKFLPLAKTDFIFASLAEELGLVGVLILFVCFLIIFYRLTFWANIFSYNFCRLFTIGFLVKILVESFVNISMNLGLLPIVGIALPFVSLGGSHFLANFIGLGIINSMIQRA